MARLLIAVAIGAVIAVGATFLTSSLVLGIANGSAVHGSLFTYGSR
jgi:F0F1-type ATP synthase membrane subunit c/vacuolar-type H+-ATPase subunit K